MALITDMVETNFKLKELKLDEDKHEEKKEKVLKQEGVVEGKKNSETTGNSSKKCSDFDTVIGYIEDMLIDDDFHDLQKKYLEKYWEEFVDDEENKHSYMRIFTEYTNEIENFIEKYLVRLIPNFVMDQFITELEKRKNELEGEVFEVLFTLTDFNAFKEMFLDYRQMKEGNVVDLGQSLCVTSIP